MSTRIIKNYKGESQSIECLGCAREEGVLKTNDTILKTEYFEVHQDYEIPIPGFLIMSTRRHIQSIDEFTQEEKLNYIETIVKIRKALRQVLKIDVVYFYQSEHTSHHFHVWIFPRYKWMETKFGKKIESVRPIMEYSRSNLKTPKKIKEVDNAILKLRNYLQD